MYLSLQTVHVSYSIFISIFDASGSLDIDMLWSFSYLDCQLLILFFVFCPSLRLRPCFTFLTLFMLSLLLLSGSGCSLRTTRSSRGTLTRPSRCWRRAGTGTGGTGSRSVSLNLCSASKFFLLLNYGNFLRFLDGLMGKGRMTLTANSVTHFFYSMKCSTFSCYEFCILKKLIGSSRPQLISLENYISISFTSPCTTRPMSICCTMNYFCLYRYILQYIFTYELVTYISFWHI